MEFFEHCHITPGSALGAGATHVEAVLRAVEAGCVVGLEALEGAMRTAGAALRARSRSAAEASGTYMMAVQG